MNLHLQIMSAIGVAGVAAVVDTPQAIPDDGSAIAVILKLVERFGVMAVLLVYFVIRDFLRYRADQAEKAEYRAKIQELTTEISGDHKRVMATQDKHIERAKRTHDMLLDTLEDFKPTSAAAKVLNHTESDTRIQAIVK